LSSSSVSSSTARRTRAQARHYGYTHEHSHSASRRGSSDAGNDSDDDNDAMAQWTFNVTREAYQMGLRVSAGTDDIGDPNDGDPYPNLHNEIELLVTRCGFTNMDAIVAATRTSAAALNILDSYGTINRGKVADLLILTADPVDNIVNTRSIEWVLKQGVIYQGMNAKR